jgi:hypothetical protein
MLQGDLGPTFSDSGGQITPRNMYLTYFRVDKYLIEILAGDQGSHLVLDMNSGVPERDSASGSPRMG